MRSLLTALAWTRGYASAHYATAVRAGGWALAGYEVGIDRFRNPSLLTAATGMILFKAVVKKEK